MVHEITVVGRPQHAEGGSFSRVQRPRGGFTILEILIASSILAMGLVMILGLFPFGIDVGRQVVQNTTSIQIARSVADAIRYGMRNDLRVSLNDSQAFTYFVFQHDGVETPVPADASRERGEHDYFILLPRHRRNARFDGTNRREKAVQRGKIFVYPETDPDASSSVSANGGPRGNPFKADDDKDDGEVDGFPTIHVRKTYKIGSTFPQPGDEGAEVLEDQIFEPLKQYSYAFSIRQSLYDADLSESPRQFEPANELFHVRVMIFRSFEQNNPTGDRIIDPIFELDFEVAR